MGVMSPQTPSSSPNSGPGDRQTQLRWLSKGSSGHITTRHDWLPPFWDGEGPCRAGPRPSKGKAIVLPLGISG